MSESIQQLESRIQNLVRAGVFSSEQEGVDSILHWLQKLEDAFIEQQLREQDA